MRSEPRQNFFILSARNSSKAANIPNTILKMTEKNPKYRVFMIVIRKMSSSKMMYSKFSKPINSDGSPMKASLKLKYTARQKG